MNDFCTVFPLRMKEWNNHNSMLFQFKKKNLYFSLFKIFFLHLQTIWKGKVTILQVGLDIKAQHIRNRPEDSRRVLTDL